MKYLYVSTFFLLFITNAFSQKLKLVKGQKYSYEYLTENSFLFSQEFKSLTFFCYQFEVLNIKRGIYNMEMRVDRRITFNSGSGRIEDSNHRVVPAKNIFTVIYDVLVKSPIKFSMDTSGNVIDIFGLDSLAAKITRRSMLEKVPENIDGDTNKDFIKIEVQRESFIQKIQLAFNNNNTKKIDTSYHKLTPEIVDSEIIVKKETLIDRKSGVTQFCYEDSLSQGIVPGKSRKHEDHGAWWFSLKSSNVKGLTSPFDLLSKFSVQTNLAAYYNLEKKVIREVDDLYEWFGENKGRLGINDIAVQKLDSLGKLIKADDPGFNAAMIRVLGSFDYDGKMRLIDQVPMDYLRTDADVADKANLAYLRRDLPTFTAALKLMFSKFAKNGEYPSNVHLLVELANFRIAEDVYSPKTTNDDLLQINNMVKTVIQLKIPKLTSIFDGIDAYLKAMLAHTKKEIEQVSTEQFNSVFDYYGRYRLLIYDRMKTLKVSDSLSKAYLEHTIQILKSGIETAGKPLTDPYNNYDNKVAALKPLLRKQLADAYYRKSLSEPKNSTTYLQLASEYLPTMDDQLQNMSIISNEYPFLPEINYTELYLNTGGSKGISSEMLLKKYVDMVILEPERYSVLKDKYLMAFPQGNFKNFFTQTLKEKLPQIPKFSLKERNGAGVNNSIGTGKYVFIDFWGTWCGPCVAEIDKVQDLHVNNPLPDKLIVTTIACRDKKKFVDEFMEKRMFSYQVLMSDNKVEKDFKVTSYPTKLLLLPNDVYLIIPSSADYKKELVKYVNWDL